MQSRLLFFSALCLLFSTSPLIAQSEPTKPVQPWGGAALGDWQNSENGVVISDLSRCEPQSALSDMVLKRHRWKVIPYQLTSGLEGKMIWAPPEAESPEVSVSLGCEGWHAIFVGLFSVVEAPTMAWIRMDDDSASVPRYNQRTQSDRARNQDGHTEEVFFRAVRLTAQSRLRIKPQTTGSLSPCGVTHVRVIPLSEAEIRQVEQENSGKSHRVLAATNDGFSDLFYWSPRTKAALLSQIELFRNTDFETLILHCPGADKTTYPSQVGFLKGSESEVFPRANDRYFVESLRSLAHQHINPIETLTKRAQEFGMRVHVAVRPAGWSFYEPYSDYWESPFYKDHPTWRCEDRDGTPVTRMSWAVPEVRKHMIDLLKELVHFGANGASIIFTRGYPLVLYEKPARELFQTEFGVDPREVPETDPRITKFRTDVVTKFFEELRTALDEEQKLRGNDAKRLALSVLISGSGKNDFDDLVYGVDLPRLVKANLVDEVFTEHGFGATAKDFNLDFLREVCQPAGVPFSPGIYSSGTPYASVLPKYYKAKPHGLTVWDAACTDIFAWCWMSRFGHVEETLWRVTHLDLSKPPRTIYKFRKLGNQVRDGRYGPHWGG